MPVRLCFVCERCEKESDLKYIRNLTIKKGDIPKGYSFDYFGGVPNFDLETHEPILSVICCECQVKIEKEYNDVLNS